MKIFITGTSKGLGFTLATELSKMHEVVGVARREVKNSSWVQLQGDISVRHDLEKLKEPLAECDVLINNAAVGYDGLLPVQGEQVIEDLISINLTAPILLTKYWSKQRIAKKKSGILINISSICGIRGYSGLSVYGATKAGLDGFTRALARELGKRNFRINSVLPGYMETDMSKTLDESKKDMIVRRTPFGRLATTEDIVPVVKFLISDDSRFITGQTIVVDGGATL